jgi:hypothetical protein
MNQPPSGVHKDLPVATHDEHQGRAMDPANCIEIQVL